MGALRSCLRALLSGALVFTPLRPAAALETTNTAALVTQAVTSYPACSYWHPSGVCFFLFCTIFGCKIRKSARYSHFIPDLVVSTYHDVATHPWPLVGIPLASSAKSSMNSLMSALTSSDSAGTRSRGDRTDQQRRFRDADAIGHPASYLGTCPSAAGAFIPYFQSLTDAMVWRGFLPLELAYPASMVPGLREVGAWPLNSWGNVHPRTGELVQHHPVKAAAVLSQRVADIVTRGGPHVYLYLSSGAIRARGTYMVWDPPVATEMNFLGGLWQMSAPVPEMACRVFGAPDAGPISYGDFKTSASAGYAYTLWRPYACCKRRGLFLYYIPTGLW